MKPTADFLNAAEKHIRLCLQDLRPKLLEAHGMIEHELKDDKSVVTKMDVLVETTLRDHLQKLDAGIAFCGEETGSDYSHDTYWLVDPIDGTESFVRGLPFSTNMVALIHDHRPIMSIIYNFFLDEYFLAIKGKGATKDGHPIHVSKRQLDRAYIIVSINGHKHPSAAGLMDALKDKGGNILRMAGAGYEFGLVATGAVDARVAYYGTGLPHDFAAGMLLVEEAGGKIGNLGTDKYDLYAPHPIVTNGVIYDELKQFIEETTTAQA
jgi:myo-inositol-1(or 4)-monophosphatase